MITKEKLKIYERYNGDGDRMLRAGSKSENQIMEPKDWGIIDSLLQDISLCKKGLTSEGFANNLKRRLAENCANEEVIKQMEMLAA